MPDSVEQVLAHAIDDLNAGRLEDPDHYLGLVPTDQRDDFRRRLAAIMIELGPIEGVDEPTSELRAAALAAVAEVRGSAGPTGILPGALKEMRKARGIERDQVLDALAADFNIGEGGRPAMRQYYHQLESGQLLGSRLSHRLLRSLATTFDAEPKDFIAAVQPLSTATKPTLAPAMGRGSGEPLRRASGHAGRQHKPADPDVALVEQLFVGGPDA